MMETKAQVRTFVLGNFYVADAKALADDTSLIDQGIVDSTGVLEVIGFVESAFGVTVTDDEMLPENLDSIAQIVAFVERKKAAAAT